MRCLPAFLGLLLAAASLASANQQQQGARSSLRAQNADPSSGGGQAYWGQQQQQQPSLSYRQQPRTPASSGYPSSNIYKEPSLTSYDQDKFLEKETSFSTNGAQPQQLLTVQTVPVQQQQQQVAEAAALEQKKKWSPGYVAATLADAWANVLKTKAEGKYKKEKEQEQVTILQAQPQPQPLPQKSKNFSFTNIKLQTSASGELPNVDFNSRVGLGSEQDATQQLAQPQYYPVQTVVQPVVPPVEVSGVRPAAAEVSGPRSPFVTENVGQLQPASGQLPPLRPSTSPFVTENVGQLNQPANAAAPTTTELQAKLTELQAQLAELERLKLELIDAREDAARGHSLGENNYTPHSPPPPPGSSSSAAGLRGGSSAPLPAEGRNPFIAAEASKLRRKLLDSGMPGWDPGALLVKKIDITASQIQALREKLGEGADGVKESLQSTVEIAGQVQEVLAGALQAKEDRMEAALDEWRKAREFAAGSVQDAIGRAMEKKAERQAEWWGLGELDRTFWR